MVPTHYKNRYKNHTFVVESRIYDLPKDITIDVSGFKGFRASNLQNKNIRRLEEHPNWWIQLYISYNFEE